MKSCLSHKNFFVVLLCASVLGLVAGVAKCETIIVKADGSGDYPTIQDAIDDCNDGDVIACAPNKVLIRIEEV